MDNWLVIFAIASILTSPAASVATMVMPLRRDLPYYTGDYTEAPYFIGYTYNGDCEFFEIV
jgi:hypothetical protein